MQNLVAHPIPMGHTWTLTTYALKYLDELEQLYGPRTTTYIYGGVELIQTGPPKVWYPMNKYVVVQVTASTAAYLPQALFQLAHEMVHVLSPNGQATTNILEEGLATWFSKLATDRDSRDPNYAEPNIAASKYKVPFDMVSQLLAIDGDAIKKLRNVQPVLGLVSVADFPAAGLRSVPDELVQNLVAPMVY